ncbi:butyrophilin subfamily 2 member A2 [Scophthalmus maximus]|nr:butyrophilin subfamily 2 member A2 [Scophthalmus maximus]
MDWTIFVILPVVFQPSLSVLFTVEAERNMYESQFGGDVVMGCRFQPKSSDPSADLKVTWHWIKPESDREVYQMNNGAERSASPEYQGRVRLLTEELREGWAKLKLSRLRINDSGTYQCLVETAEGADYKTIALSVVAPYTAVTKRLERTAEGDGVLLTCQSEGYPKSSVVWQDENLQRLRANTTSEPTPDQRYKVTSQMRVSSSDRDRYTCNFTNDGRSATFRLPEEIPVPQKKNNALIVILSIGVVVAVVSVAVLMYLRRKKGSRSPSAKNLLGDGRPFSAATCVQIDKDNEEERTIPNEDAMEENLRVFLKKHYSQFFGEDVGRSWGAFGLEELPHKLQNNEGQAVKLEALLPEAGETLFLEGPPGSGKTTVAHILISSWTEGSTSPLGLSSLRLLLHVDCSAVERDLFQEVATQLSLTEKTSMEDELRTAFTRSSEALLLLDGYREGNHVFDVSLQRFLRDRGGCRVLVTACPGHCPTLREAFGTGGVLKLQAQTV